MNGEQLVSVAARMYDCRRSLKSLFADRYAEIVDPYGKVIRHVATERGLDILQAALEMGKEMQALHKDPVITICLMAAAVDIIEPENSSGPSTGDDHG
jgi:hypothetical protein